MVGPPNADDSQVVEAISWADEDEDDQLPLHAPGGAIEHLTGQVAEAHRKIEILETPHTEESDMGEIPELKDT